MVPERAFRQYIQAVQVRPEATRRSPVTIADPVALSLAALRPRRTPRLVRRATASLYMLQIHLYQPAIDAAKQDQPRQAAENYWMEQMSGEQTGSPLSPIDAARPDQRDQIHAPQAPPPGTSFGSIMDLYRDSAPPAVSMYPALPFPLRFHENRSLGIECCLKDWMKLH